MLDERERGLPERPRSDTGLSAVVARNAFFLLLGQVATTALSIALNAALARSLGAAEYGLLFLVTSIATFAYVLVDFGKGTYMTREAARDPERTGDLLGTSITLRVIGALLVCGPMLLVTTLLQYDSRVRALSTLMIGAMLPLMLVHSWTAMFRARERMELDAVVSTFAKAVTLAVTLAVLAGGGKLFAAIAAQASGGTAALFLAARLSRRLDLPPLRASRAVAREMIIGGVPFAALLLTISAQGYLDALVLSKLAPVVVMGWYGAARNIINALITPASILASATFPRLARASSDPVALRLEIRTALRPLLAMGSLAAVGTFWFADVAVSIVYGTEEFAPAVLLLQIFAPLLLLFMVGALLGTAATVCRPGALAAGKGAAIVVSTGTSILMVPFCQARFGDGAIGLLLGFAVGESLMVVAATALLPSGTLDRRSMWELGRALLAGGGTLGLLLLLPPLPAALGIVICVVAFAGLAVALGLVNREELRSVVAMLRKRSRAGG